MLWDGWGFRRFLEKEATWKWNTRMVEESYSHFIQRSTVTR